VKEALAAAAARLGDAIYLRGSVAHVQGDLKACVGHYDTAPGAPAHAPESLVSRAGMLLDTGKLPEAERDVTNWCAARKPSRGALYLKALIAERQGNAGRQGGLNEITALLDPVPVSTCATGPSC
jgi:cellulose synthase operon protein C